MKTHRKLARRSAQARRNLNRRPLHLESLEDRSLLAIDVNFRLEATSLTGAPVSTVHVGEHFKLNVYAQDMRANPQGVFAGYMDIDYDAPFGSVALRERERVVLAGPPTGGTFQLTFQGQTTVPIVFNPAQPAIVLDGIRGALEGLNNIEPGEVTVTRAPGGSTSFEFFVQFGGQYANQNVPNMTASSGGLVGGTGITITESGGAVLGSALDFVASVSTGAKYPNGLAALDARNDSPAALNEIGAFDGFLPFGGAEELLFSVEYIAQSSGTMSFFANPAENLPANHVLVFGDNLAVPVDRISFGRATVIVEGTPPPPPPPPPPGADALDFGLSVTDVNGNPVSQLRVGQEFLLHGKVQDIRSNPLGPFAAYVDVLYTSKLAAVVGNLLHPAPFSSGVAGGAAVAGLIDEAGGFSPSQTPTGGGVLELFTQRMRAIATGTLSFSNNPADLHPVHDLLVYGDNSVVSGKYHQLSITVLPGPTARPDSFTVDKNAPIASFNVLANDVNSVRVQSVSPGSRGGTVQVGTNGSNVRYAPAPNFVGIETFSYVVTDGQGGTSTATVTMNVRLPSNSSLSGFVYVDANGDGFKQGTEAGIANVTVNLTGVDGNNRPVSLKARTDTSGRYSFSQLSPGVYEIAETQPANYADGIDRIGTQGGGVVRNDVFRISLGANVNGVNNNFGEITPASGLSKPASLQSTSSTTSGKAASSTTGTGSSIILAAALKTNESSTSLVPSGPASTNPSTASGLTPSPAAVDWIFGQDLGKRL